MTLGLGIGANVAIFSVIDGVLLKPLPYPHPGELVAVKHTAPGIHIAELPTSPSLDFTYRDENRVFQELGMWEGVRSTVTGLAEPDEVPALLVTSRVLPMLGVQPVLGRGFTDADADPKSPPTLMLSYGYWKSRFGGERSVLGKRLMVDGAAQEVIGVLPASFTFMDYQMSLVAPLQLDRSRERLVHFSYQGIARLKPGVTLAQANADVARMIAMAPAKFAPNAG